VKLISRFQVRHANLPDRLRVKTPIYLHRIRCWSRTHLRLCLCVCVQAPWAAGSCSPYMDISYLFSVICSEGSFHQCPQGPVTGPYPVLSPHSCT